MRPLHDGLLCAHPAFCKYCCCCCCCCCCSNPLRGRPDIEYTLQPPGARSLCVQFRREKEKIFISSSATCSRSLSASLNHGSVDPVMTLDRCLQSTPPGSVKQLHCEISRNGPAGLRRNAWPLLAAPLLVNHGLSQIYSTTSCHAAPAPAPARATPRHTISTAANLCLHGHGSLLTAVDPLPH